MFSRRWDDRCGGVVSGWTGLGPGSGAGGGSGSFRGVVGSTIESPSRVPRGWISSGALGGRCDSMKSIASFRLVTIASGLVLVDSDAAGDAVRSGDWNRIVRH